jgi:fibronectin-binding autotransporter adhesin
MNKLGLNDLMASVRLGGALCLAVLCGVLAAGSSAQTNSTWTDATGNWSNAANWSNGVPNGNFNALISNGNPGVATVNLDINATIANLELDTQNTLNIQAGKTLTFQSSSGSTALGGGTINVASGGTILVAAGGSLATFSDTSSTNINLLGASSLITGATGTEKLTLLAVNGSGAMRNAQFDIGSVTVSGGTMTITPNSNGVDIEELLVVNAGSTLNITGEPFKNFDPTTGTLSGVAAGCLCDPTIGIHLQGTLKFDGANILALSFGVPLTLDGPNAKIVDQNNNNALTNLSSLGLQGKLQLENGASLSTNVGLSANNFNDLEVRSGSTLNIGGTLEFSESRVTVDASTMKVSGDFDLFGGDAPGDLTVSNGGKLTVLGAYTQQSGGVTSTALAVSHGSTMSVSGAFGNQADASGSGDVTVDGNSALSVGGSFTATGGTITTISNSSTLSIGKDFAQTVITGCTFCPFTPVLNVTNGSSAIVGGSVNNAGTIGVDGTSSLTAKGGFNQNGGSTLVNGVLNVTGTGANFQGGTLSGTGTLNGNLTMAGMMMPGNPTGTFTLNGNYTQTSAGTLAEQVGWLNGSNANLFKVSGTASLAGTLALSLLSGYNPMVGDSFILMTFLSDTGTFSNVTGTNLGNNLMLDVIYDAHDVRVEVEAASVAAPEPGSNLLLLAGLLPMLGLARKRFASGMRSA